MIGEYIPCTMIYIKPYLSNLAKSMQIHLLLVLVENVMNGNISISRTAYRKMDVGMGILNIKIF